MKDNIKKIDAMFDFAFANHEQYKREFEKAQELLNHLDRIRAYYGSRMAIKFRL